MIVSLCTKNNEARIMVLAFQGNILVNSLAGQEEHVLFQVPLGRKDFQSIFFRYYMKMYTLTLNSVFLI